MIQLRSKIEISGRRMDRFQCKNNYGMEGCVNSAPTASEARYSARSFYKNDTFKKRKETRDYSHSPPLSNSLQLRFFRVDFAKWPLLTNFLGRRPNGFLGLF